MKGVSLVVSEVLLFALGVLITAYIITNFNNLQVSIKEVALRDQLFEVSSFIRMGIVTVFESGPNSTIRLNIPKKLSGLEYKIKVSDDFLTVIIPTAPEFNVTQQLFNITKGYSIKGDVSSSAESIILTFDGKTVNIMR